MRETNASKSLLVAGITTLVVAGLCFFLVGGREANQAKADKGTTTERAAEAAGAEVTPTEPKLRVEPK